MRQWYRYILIAPFIVMAVSTYAQNEDTLAAPSEIINPKAGKILTGYVKTTSPVLYGGGIYCEYTTVLHDIRIWLRFSKDGYSITSATVVFLAKETPGSTCTYEGFKPTNHYYHLRKPVPVQNGKTISEMELAGNEGNRPACVLLFSGEISRTGVFGKIHLHRTDQKAPLDYSIDIPVELH